MTTKSRTPRGARIKDRQVQRTHGSYVDLVLWYESLECPGDDY